MSVRGEITPRVAQILELIRSDDPPTNSDIAQRFGITASAIKDIRRRYGHRAPVGRPNLSRPLTDAQQRLVEDYMRFAAKVALRWLREKSRCVEWDEPEYLSCAYLGLVKAASRWKGTGSFAAFCAKYIEGAIRDYRRADMLANGWAWETNAHRKMTQEVERGPLLDRLVKPNFYGASPRP